MGHMMAESAAKVIKIGVTDNLLVCFALKFPTNFLSKIGSVEVQNPYLEEFME